MNKKTTLIKSALSFCAIMAGLTVHAQFTETIGTVGVNGSTIATHETNDRFDQDALTYSGTADVRNTSNSTGYTGASGGYNILIQGLETFVVGTIDASACTTSNTISFGILKTTTASNGIDSLKLEYSINGGSWINIPYPALPTGTGTANKWYLRSTNLPAGACAAGLSLRFRSTFNGNSSQNPQFRIDDLAMTCGSTVDCSGLEATAEVVGDNVFCAGTSSADIAVTTTVTSPDYQWYDQEGPVVGETNDFITVDASGTYYVIVSNEDGCEVTSNAIYILAYPAPEVCVAEITGCEEDVVEYCPTIKTSDLIISEYVEGSSFNKYLELYNGTCETLNLEDYEVRTYHNGATIPFAVIPLTGTLASGDVFVLANEDATAWGGTPDLLTEDFQVNGDDAIVLYNVAATFPADIFGSVGNDPGSAWRDTVTTPPSATLGWRTENKTLVRKPCVYSGITVNPALPGIYGFPTLFTEWDTLPEDAVAGLGAHTFGPAAFSFSITSGASTITSSTATCARVTIGDGASVLAVDASFCGFNNCGPIEVAINEATEGCAGLRSSSAVEGAEVLKAEVYPNPFQDKTVIAIELEQDGEVALNITDLSGQVVLAQTFEGVAGKQRFELNLAGLANGTYVCNIESANGFETVRIVKSK